MHPDRLLTALVPLLFVGCASLHQVSIGEIDNTTSSVKVEVKSSEMGLDVEQATQITKAISNNRTVHKTANTVSDIWQLITYGPKTGEVTFSDNYAVELPQKLALACPTGKLTGVTSIRETNKYPVISGEIVKLTAYCAMK